MAEEIQPSKISRLYDEFLGVCKRVFPEHSELRDVQDLSNNPDQVLRAAFGIEVGSGENTEREFTCTKYTLAREFVIVITREVLRQEEDVRTMHEKTKQILEDLHALLRVICGQYVAGAAGELAFKVRYDGDQGPQLIDVGSNSYSFIEATITAEYSQKTTGGF